MDAGKRVTLEFVLQREAHRYEQVPSDRYNYLTLIRDAYEGFHNSSFFCKYRLDNGMEISSDVEIARMFELYKDHDVIQIYIEPEEKGRSLVGDDVSPEGRAMLKKYRRRVTPRVVRKLVWKENGDYGKEGYCGTDLDDGQDSDSSQEVQRVAEVGKDVRQEEVQGEDVSEYQEVQVEERYMFTDSSCSDTLEPNDVNWAEEIAKEVEPEVRHEVDDDGLESSDFEEVDDNNKTIRDTDSDEDWNEDQNLRRRTSKKVKMDPVLDYGGQAFERTELIQFEVGQFFKNAHEFKEVLKDYLIKGGYNIKFIKNDSVRLTAACAGKCPWRIHASALSGQEIFMIKMLVNEHTCMSIASEYWATPQWIARQIGDLLDANPKLDNKTIHATLKDRGLEPKNWKLWKAKCYHRKKKFGTHVESFAKLYAYSELLWALNPGSIVKLQGRTLPNPQNEVEFWRVFVCLGTVRLGFVYRCRPLIGIDGCHLKGPFGGTMLAAISLDANNCIISLDANNCIVPLAWAIVDKENGKNWKWFIELLYSAVGDHSSGKALTIMLDGQKGLGNQIEASFPNARHRRCAKHISANFRAAFKGVEVEGMFWELVYATTRTDKHMALLKKKKILAKRLGANMFTPATWLESISPEKWSRHGFDDYVKSMDVTNNLVESFNNWALKVRELPIIDLLDKLRQKMMKRQHKRYLLASQCETRFAPKVMKRLIQLSSECRKLKVIPARDLQFEVLEEGKKFAVEIIGKTCSCRVWQLSKVPCIHVGACVAALEGNLEDYVHEYFSVEMWKKTYQHIIHPFPDVNLDPTDGLNTYLPPKLTRHIGRPRISRRRQEGEKHASLRSNTVKCGYCGLLGHNRRRCQGAPTKVKRQKGKRTKVEPHLQAGRGKGDGSIVFEVGNGSGTVNAQPTPEVGLGSAQPAHERRAAIRRGKRPASTQ